MELEGLAAKHGPVEALPGGYALSEQGKSTRLLAATAGPDGLQGQRRLRRRLVHATVAAGLAEWVNTTVTEIMLGASNRKEQPKIAIGGEAVP